MRGRCPQHRKQGACVTSSSWVRRARSHLGTGAGTDRRASWRRWPRSSSSESLMISIVFIIAAAGERHGRTTTDKKHDLIAHSAAPVNRSSTFHAIPDCWSLSV
jgi:hypothetical protein